MKICFRAVVCPSGPAVLLLGSVLTWRCWLYIHCLAGRHGLGARGHQSCWGMRWSGVNKNERQKRHKLNVGRGASDMPVVLGEVVEPRSFSGGASKHPPLPSPQTTGRESSPRTGPLALPSSPQPTENMGRLALPRGLERVA